MVVIIPEQLKKEEFRFVRLNGKIPIDFQWQKNNNFKYDDQRILSHKNNFGIVCGRGNLVVVDIDGNSEDTLKVILKTLPETFIVKTGKQGYHLYYLTEEIVKTTSLEFNNSHIDIKAEGGQIVIPGSIHPETKRKYEIYNPKELTTIKKQQLLDFFNINLQNVEKVKSLKINTILSNKEDDKTRSATEYRTVLSLIGRGKTREQIYQQMDAFDKWKHSDDRYKKKTYDKAIDYINQKKSEPINEENIKYRVIELLCDTNKDTKAGSHMEAEEILVSYLIKKFYFKTLQQDENQEIWGYDSGIYLPIGHSLAREELRFILGMGFNDIITKKVISKITADTYINSKDFFRNEYPFLLPVNNGILNLKTLELEEFNPDKIFFTKLNISFNKKSKCPNIVQHLKNVLKESDDITLFQEAVGNCLIKKYTYQKAVMMVGSGRNGKGVTLDLINRLLGVENCSAITLEQLEKDQFSLSELHGKLANLGGDLNKTSLNNTGKFKTATGGDLLTAPRKFMTPIYFINYAKFFFACNELPLVYDNSRGFWDRWLYFEFPYTFVVKEEYDNKTKEEQEKLKIADPKIKDQLFEPVELEGFLNFALKGMERLVKQNKFSQSGTFEQIKNKWIRQSDSFRAFCLDRIETSWDSTIIKSDLRQAYYDYCKANQVRAVGDKHIKQTLTEEYGAGSKQVHDKHNPDLIERVWVWDGVKLK